MIPNAYDSDNTSPVERIAMALEHIADSLQKIAKPQLTVDKDGNVTVLR